MISLDKIRKPILKDLEMFEEFIVKQFTAEGELMSEMVEYAISSRGKGIRPMIVLLSAAMNSKFKCEGVGQRAYLAAMLVEMTHVASLIHDDVIDEADTRRGKPSVSAKWQSHKAVILGDYILARNMNIGLASGQYDLVSFVCKAIATLCEGEVFQSDCADKISMTRDAYLNIIYKKTASLIGISASMGALAVKAPSERVDLMRRFGEAVGMAFQIQDDILDFTRESQTGKPSNNDLREQKITLPLLIILEKVSEERKAELIERLSRCNENQEDVDYLQYIVEMEGGISMAMQVMQQYINKAISMLAEYEESPYRDALINLCTYIIERDR